MTELLPHLEHDFNQLKRGDLLVLDLDNTVFREVQMLGTDEWYASVLHRRMETGLDKKAAIKSLEKDNVRIKVATKARLMEREIATLIFRLQKRGVFVIGLTARHPRLASVTHIRLRGLGVEFSHGQKLDLPNPTANAPGLDNDFLFSGNIAFTDGSPKGVVLRHLVTSSGVAPKRVIAIDDRIYHVHTFVEALLELKVAGRVIHYLKYQEEEAFNAEWADHQYSQFIQSGRIPSDEEAKKYCASLLTGSEWRHD